MKTQEKTKNLWWHRSKKKTSNRRQNSAQRESKKYSSAHFCENFLPHARSLHVNGGRSAKSEHRILTFPVSQHELPLHFNQFCQGQLKHICCRRSATCATAIQDAQRVFATRADPAIAIDDGLLCEPSARFLPHAGSSSPLRGWKDTHQREPNKRVSNDASGKYFKNTSRKLQTHTQIQTHRRTHRL